MPGVEPGSQAWEACMMPLHYMRHAMILEFGKEHSVRMEWARESNLTSPL